MAKPTGFGLASAVSAIVALAAAATAVGIMGSWASDMSGYDWPWWMIAVIATGSVAMLAALLVIGFQLALRCGGAGSLAGVLFCVLGLGVHVALLACWTYQLAKDYTIAGPAGYFSYSGNAFDNWDYWTSEDKALFIFGCCIGVLFWILALVFAVMDVSASKKRQAEADEAAAAVLNVGMMQAGHEAPKPQATDYAYV